ncbi:MAG: prepilin-type N-terminal cleavage/methylation domain-containing protein [Minisyncoccia bacterium]
MIINHYKLKNGFSLIEALIAIAILIVGILSAFLLLIRTTATIPSMQARLTAVNLAQEGIEEIRALRDTDFLNDTKGFKSFLNGHSCGTGCHIAVNNENGSIELFDGQGEPLKLNESTHLYTYNPDDPDSIFSRSIIIDSTPTDFINVTVNVIYNIKDKTQTVEASDRLYNWLNP